MPCFLAIALDAATNIPNTKKPPGGSKKITIGAMLAGITCKEKIVPAPKSSRIAPISVSVAVKPIPIPKPSNMLGTTAFLDANIQHGPK